MASVAPVPSVELVMLESVPPAAAAARSTMLVPLPGKFVTAAGTVVEPWP